MTILTLQPDGTSGIDAMIDQLNVTTNYGTNVELVSGERDDIAAQYYRSLIKFDLSVIPKTARIIRAELTLTLSNEKSSNIRDHKFYRVLKNWVESEVTFTIYSSGNNWASLGMGSGLDYDATALATVTMSATETPGTTKTWSLNLTEFTKMVNGTYSNYGFVLIADTQNNDAIFYHSSDAVTASNRPKLVVEYAIFGGSPMISPFGKF